MSIEEIQKMVADQIDDAYRAGQDDILSKQDLIRGDLLAELDRAKGRMESLRITVEERERTLRKVTGVDRVDVEAMRDVAQALGATEEAKPTEILEKLRDLVSDSNALHAIHKDLNLGKGDTVVSLVKTLQVNADKFENLKELMK